MSKSLLDISAGYGLLYWIPTLLNDLISFDHISK